MCGILGSINLPFNQPIVDMLSHRGPDDAGVSAFNVKGHAVLFGHRRLSILDLSDAGHQPMISSCGKYAISYNGEIYNHLQLREKLPEVQFKGHSDTETILYYLRKYGISSVRDLNGIFAIAFLDLGQNQLYLARDPFGVKPLYYSEAGNSFTFCSEIGPIRKLIREVKLNEAALASLLRLRYNAAPHTLCEEINKVLPGHYKVIELGRDDIGSQSICYLDRPVVSKVTQASVVEQYSERIEAAVKRQLLSDVDIGILLSGGIDSAIIAALAKKHYKGKLKAFTVGFDGDNVEDEIEDAARTAQILGIEHHYKRISFGDFLSQIKECTRIVEEPVATTSIIPMYYLAELASSHVKVVLTGQGADEPLGGYRKYKLELLRSKIPSFLRTSALPLMKFVGVRNEALLRGSNALGIRSEVERFLTAVEVFDQHEIQNLIGVNDKLSLKRVKYFYDIISFKEGVSSVEKMMALDSRLSLADDLLNYMDKLTMHFSMECRVPMLDLELVKYIESLPRELKLNLTEQKRIHKIYSRTLLPHEVIKRKKKGFQSPTRNWFSREIDTIKDILLQSGTNFSKVFHQWYIAEIISQHQNGYNKEKQIFLLLTIYYWLEDLNFKKIFL
jgi:asparagine synthase (glutamine-hydrolysing)